MNDRGQRDGQGRLEYINYDISYKEGIWKNDQLNGEGKTVSTNGQEYEGVYENGQLIKGAFSSNINGDLWTYNGEFNGNYFQGVGIERREVDNQIIIKEGDFFSDKLYQGTETVLFTNSGIKIISEYVNTPLCWGIHTSVNNPISEYSQIYAKQYAISRNGSGSHLMAQIDANGQGLALKENQFEIIKNLDGALSSLEKLETDVFYWEKFTTKPYVDAGLLKRIGEFPTPWPSFMIAASDSILEKHPDKIITLLDIIHKSCENFMKDSKDVIPQVAERYQLKVKDAENWFHRTEWATDGWVSDKMLQSVIYNLKLASILTQEKPIPELIWKR